MCRERTRRRAGHHSSTGGTPAWTHARHPLSSTRPRPRPRPRSPRFHDGDGSASGVVGEGEEAARKKKGVSSSRKNTPRTACSAYWTPEETSRPFGLLLRQRITTAGGFQRAYVEAPAKAGGAHLPPLRALAHSPPHPHAPPGTGRCSSGVRARPAPCWSSPVDGAAVRTAATRGPAPRSPAIDSPSDCALMKRTGDCRRSRVRMESPIGCQATVARPPPRPEFPRRPESG